ncbi:MAG: toprim domain-containing protein [Pirellulaceae bacterium]
MSFYPKPVKLTDCQPAADGAPSKPKELIIVEGDSASQAVCAVRDPTFQAILPMQGKPLNAAKASRTAVLEFELYDRLLTALGFTNLPHSQGSQTTKCRYDRIVFVFDPDADGIHCGALTLIFFHRMLPALLAAGKLFQVRAPLFEFQLENAGNGEAHSDENHVLKRRSLYAYSEFQANDMEKELKQLKYGYNRKYFRGLASLPAALLKSQCICPETRHGFVVEPHDADAALRVFGGQSGGKR